MIEKDNLFLKGKLFKPRDAKLFKPRNALGNTGGQYILCMQKSNLWCCFYHITYKDVPECNKLKSERLKETRSIS